MLKDDLESRGPVKLSESRLHRREILVVVRKLADAGTIVLKQQGRRR